MTDEFNTHVCPPFRCAAVPWFDRSGAVVRRTAMSRAIKRTARWLGLLMTALLGLHPSDGLAEPGPDSGVAAAPRILLTNQTSFRFNPSGLGNQTRIGYQRGIYAGNSPLTQDNHWHLGANLRVTPAGVRVSAVIEVQPLAVLNLRATGGYSGYFGTFHSMQSRPSAQDELSDAAMDAHKVGPLGNYATSGAHLELETTLQFAWGRAFIRDRAMSGWYRAALRAGDRVWYDAVLDVPVANGGWVFANDLDLLYRQSLTAGKFAVGVRHTLVQPFYPADAGAAVADGQQRLGILASYTLFDHGNAAFDRPTLMINAGRYLSHRYREDAGVSAQNLFVFAGFAFQSDLWRP